MTEQVAALNRVNSIMHVFPDEVNNSFWSAISCSSGVLMGR